jgi:DNA-binding MarR family transcriptional regulator
MTMKTAVLDLDGTCNCLAARKAARYLTAAYDKALAPAGLRITQFTILNKLARLGPMTIKRLAAAMAMDRTTLATNLKPLERDGLLVTAAAEDRRATAIEIAAAGRAKLAEAIPLWALAQDQFEAGFGAEAASKLRSALGGVLEAGLDPWAE